MSTNSARAHFGPAGTAASFTEMGYKGSLDVPEYLKKFGLDAFEYQCGRGVNIGLEKASEFGKKAAEYGILLSIHAPYYISLASAEEQKRENSVKYILQSAAAAKAMGATRIVVHPGGLSGKTRQEATAIASETLKKACAALDENGLSDIRVCPETMGKINQLGDLDEILTFCSLDERFIPCIDFGHLNARTLGGLKTAEDFAAVFEKIENRLGISRLKEYHAHFSKIEYTKGGEKQHLTFADTLFGPDFEPVIELTLRKNCAPTIICESAGTQSEDAKTMMSYYNSLI